MIQGNRGLITAEFMLTEAEGMDMGRKYNDDVELRAFSPQ